jgi:integrase
VVSIDSGLRASEIRNLRRGDIRLAGEGSDSDLIVGQSKTDAGTGRVVPLTRRAVGALTSWLQFLPEAGPDAYLFPRHSVGFGKDGKPFSIANVNFKQPMQGWKSAWSRARKLARVEVRWHDLRHTLVSRLAENPTISEETIRALAGHVSRQMLSRYAHIRAQAKRAAIATLEQANDSTFEEKSPQKSSQSVSLGKQVLN